MELTLDKHKIKITNQDKILFPESGITKGDLVTYYEKIAPFMLPHLYNRPLNMQRFPNGIGKPGFYHKDRPDYFPKWIKSIEVEKEDGTVCQVLTNNAATLVYLANQNCITFHTWLCLKDKLHFPDKLIFDLDPEEDKFNLAVKAAKVFKDYFENEFKITVYLMLTGSKGLHVVIPLNRKSDFDTAKNFAKTIAEIIAKEYPDDFTTEIRKIKREGRLFLDFLRNAYAQTGVTPYSVRARENAPVAAPISWKELNNNNLNSQMYNIKNIFDKLKKEKNPWHEFNENAIGITAALKKIKLK